MQTEYKDDHAYYHVLLLSKNVSSALSLHTTGTFNSAKTCHGHKVQE